MVSGRRSRRALSRFVSGFAKTSFTQASDERQRLGHARSRDNGGLGTTGYLTRKNIALCAFSEWQTRKLLERDRGAPVTDARRRRRSDSRSAQSSHAGLDRDG